MEASIFAWAHYEELSQQAKQEAPTYEQDAKLTELLRQLNWETPDEDKQKHQEALSRAQEMKAKQDTETAMLGRTLSGVPTRLTPSLNSPATKQR